MAFVKKLTFESNDLGIEADLLLTFDDQPIAGLYKSYYPSAFAYVYPYTLHLFIFVAARSH